MISVVDIWSSAFSEIWPYIHPVGMVDGKTLYKSCLDKYFFLTDRGEYL